MGSSLGEVFSCTRSSKHVEDRVLGTSILVESRLAAAAAAAAATSSSLSLVFGAELCRRIPSIDGDGEWDLRSNLDCRIPVGKKNRLLQIDFVDHKYRIKSGSHHQRVT